MTTGSPVSRTLLSIQADFNNALVWMVSIRPLIFDSSTLLSKLLETIQSAPITIYITVGFMSHNFLCFLERSKYLSLFSLTLIFTLRSTGSAKSHIRQVLLIRLLSLSLILLMDFFFFFFLSNFLFLANFLHQR